MCELFGLSCNKEVGIKFSFSKFQKKSSGNPHGWGIGYYTLNKYYGGEPFATILKEPIPAEKTTFSDFLKNQIKSKIFVSHIRRASVGAKVPLNTHPFELMLDPRDHKDYIKEKSWIFAHNGSIIGIKKDPQFKPEICTHGNTDSEHAFCYIISKLREEYRANNYSLNVNQKAEIIKRLADKISDKYPETLNFIISDGICLFAYYSGYDGCGGLHYMIREGPFQLRDSEMSIELEKAPDEKACLVATEPLSEEENWIKFKKNSLIVFKDGEKVLELE
jgi:predicted glutamine amidotransferase